MTSKIIVLGAVNGQLQSAFTKLTSITSKKSDFSFAIIVGNLFGDDNESVNDLLSGKIQVPLTTYFTVGVNPLPGRIIERIEKDEEICPNLHYLGKRSVTKTSEGIRIVVLGGQLDEAIVGGLSKEQHLPFHTASDAKALNGANSADILLTTSWPASIRTGSRNPLPSEATEPPTQEHITDLCIALKPRYHFTQSPDFFFEREPFFHTPSTEEPSNRPITRFISLAAYGNSVKQKALYAFSLPRSADLTAPLPPGSTASPWALRANPKKRRALESEPYSRYSSKEAFTHNQKRGKGRRGEKIAPPTPKECFFCLSNPNLARHLISSIGDESYLTIAKGPLTTSKTYALLGIDFPAHLLIIPLIHSPTINLMAQEDNSRENTFQEMSKFKESLQNMIGERSNNKLGAITYEISMARGVHVHWQFIPIPIEFIAKGLVEAAFRVEAENLSYPAFAERDPGIGQDEGDFFRVWIWTPPPESNENGITKCLTLPFDGSIRFSLQFGRTVIAKLLGLEKRLQWRDCSQSEDEEKSDLEAFKQAFRVYDFTL